MKRFLATFTPLFSGAVLQDIDHPDAQLVQQEQEQQGVLSHIPKESLEEILGPTDTVTGVYIVHGDGEYLTVWISTDSFPYANASTYFRVL